VLTNEQKLAIFHEISGPRAQDLIARLISFHRAAGGPEILQAMEVIRDQFRSAGLEEIRIERFPVGQGHSYWTWNPPYISDRLDAYLAIVSPESEKRVIYHFSETPIGLLANSSSTPSKGWEGELVHVGRGERAEDYAGLRVKDKLVLTHGRPSLVHQRAVVERGAAGMLITGTPATRLDHPDKIMAAGVPMVAALEHPFFGFSLSHRQYQVLREALNTARKEKKPLLLLARVKTRFRQGHFRALSAVIRGTEQPAKELILAAHICHPKPSANDNASGCALLAEMARTLRTLQKRGDLPVLKRSLRFLIIPEWRGTTPWLYRNRRRVRNMLGVVSLDMVGEDQEKCGGPLMVGSTHGVQQHFIGGLLAKSFRWVAAQKGPAKLRKDSLFRWKPEKYFGGTDHMPFVDPTIGVPGLYVGHPQDFFWHTDQDTLDKTDPNTLERVGTASLAFAFDLLNLADQEREEILSSNYLEAVTRLAETGRKLVEKTWSFVPKEKKGLDSWQQFHREHLQHQGKLNHELAMERAVLAACAQGLRGNLRRDVEEKATELGELLGWQGQEIRALMEEGYLTVLERAAVDVSVLRWRKSALERKADGLVVHRLFEGPFPMTTIFDKVARRDREWFHEMGEKLWQMHLYEIPFFYIDGRRTALEVHQKMEYEYGPLDLKIFLEYLEVLARAKLVQLKKMKK
jgi:aminopeptidase YwaD